MYAKTELSMYPYLQELGSGFITEEEYQQHHNHLLAQLRKEEEEEEEFLPRLYDQNISFICNSDKSFVDDQYYYHFNNQSNTARTPAVSDYDLGGEGDLFKAPKPIMDQKDPFPTSGHHHQLTAASCMLPRGEDDALNTETIGENHQQGDVFHDGKMDLFEMTVIEETFPELANMEFPTLDMGDNHATAKDDLGADLGSKDGPLQKSISCECLSRNEWSSEGSQRSSTVDFQAVDLGAAFGLRRAYSEGDIETLGRGNVAAGQASFARLTNERLRNVDDVKMEERRQKLSRYRTKKTRRNFDRKIKYACRKALADNQPRVRGRFARTQGYQVGKTSN